MKARPILFNTDMVQAILAGQKTQTRRGVKAPVLYDDKLKDEVWDMQLTDGVLHVASTSYRRKVPPMAAGSFTVKCPFGQPGDLLYVRETFRLYDSSMECACYDPCTCSRHHGKPMYFADGFSAKEELKWKPSIHMPREFSRLTLEITDVRVERLHEMTAADARSEGFNGGHGSIPGYGYSASPVEHFVHVWDSIYSNWKSNPWVWVVDFKVHHCNVDALLREREAA